MILDPGLNLTLRPMKYPVFYEMYRDAIRNTWTVDEVDLTRDLEDLARIGPGELPEVGSVVRITSGSRRITCSKGTVTRPARASAAALRAPRNSSTSTLIEPRPPV